MGRSGEAIASTFYQILKSCVWRRGGGVDVENGQGPIIEFAFVSMEYLTPNGQGE